MLCEVGCWLATVFSPRDNGCSEIRGPDAGGDGLRWVAGVPLPLGRQHVLRCLSSWQCDLDDSRRVWCSCDRLRRYHLLAHCHWSFTGSLVSCSFVYSVVVVKLRAFGLHTWCDLLRACLCVVRCAHLMFPARYVAKSSFLHVASESPLMFLSHHGDNHQTPTCMEQLSVLPHHMAVSELSMHSMISWPSTDNLFPLWPHQKERTFYRTTLNLV